MRRSWLFLMVIGSLFTAACGPGRVAVTAEIEVPNPDSEGTVTAPLAGTEVQFLPFDRDVVFDSLAAAFPTPEPPIPDDLLAAQEEIAAADQEWRSAEATWNSGRDRLQEINRLMEGLNPAESRYLELYREWQDLDGRVSRAERVKDRAFATFTGLQEGYMLRRDSMRIVQEQWADEAFAPYTEVLGRRIQETGLEMIFDTTDAQGLTLTEVPPGQWWVHARYEEAYTELYWNELITVVRGDPIQVRLDRESAERRPIL